jgi:hypothetical protein
MTAPGSPRETMAYPRIEAMRNTAAMVMAMLLAWQLSAWAQPKPIGSPDKFSGDVIELIARGAAKDAAVTITDVMGQPAAAINIQNALQVFEGKRFDYSKKVIDNNIADALRQIIHYSFVENVGFVYFRFNFKMSSKGWLLANFTFKTETNELFPKDLVDR